MIYDKIYEAISNGIQKALILPDESVDDISVIWNHKKISNDMNPQMMLNDWVHNDLMNNDTALYVPMTAIGSKYKVKDTEELFNIIYKTKDEEAFNVDWVDVSNIDMSHIYYILDDNTEIRINDYVPGMNVIFIKIVHKAKLFGNIQEIPIILHKDLLANGYNMNKNSNYIKLDGMVWKKGIKHNFNDEDCLDTLEDASYDYNGFVNTYFNSNIQKNNYGSYPAFKYVTQYKINGYIGYLPAYGEFDIFAQNIEYYIYALLKIGYKLKDTPFEKMISVWTSTEADKVQAWNAYVYYGMTFFATNIKYIAKQNEYMKRTKTVLARSGAIPFFKFSDLKI